MKLLLARPRGFCAGVDRAIETVERALDRFGAPVYVRHEIVHNGRVVADLEAKGAIFVEALEEVPVGAVTIFSAHGVSRAVEAEAKGRRLEVIDATCPLVTKVHVDGRRYAAMGYDVILIGHRGHVEVEGTLGQIDGPVHLVGTVAEVEHLAVRDPAKVAYITQTTLSLTDTREIIAALTRRFPAIVGPDVRNICYATQNRQNAVMALAPQVDVLLVAGARNSSNSTRLMEIGRDAGIRSHLVPDAAELDRGWFDGARAIGLTAGASAPEVTVSEIVERLSGWFDLSVETVGEVSETVVFKLPPEVADPPAAAGRKVA